MRALRIDLNVITPKEIDEVICLLKDEQEKKEAYEKFLHAQFKVSEFVDIHQESISSDDKERLTTSFGYYKDLDTTVDAEPEKSEYITTDWRKKVQSDIAAFESLTKIRETQAHPHYDNDNGSLYKIASDLGLNAYEFDILKRIARCRKKGQFKEDLQKIKDTVDLYLKEHE